MSRKALTFSHVQKRFDRNVVLHDVSFSIPEGRICGLFGLNGAGKTTLFRIAYGLCRPDAGGVQYVEQDVQSWRDIRLRVGLAAQLTDDVKAMSVSRLAGRMAGLHPLFSIDRLGELMAQADIPDQRIGVLSQGQRTLLSLCLALAAEPEVLLVDEPFANVDVENRSRFMALLVEEAHLKSSTIVIASHLIDQLAGLVDMVAILHNGVVQPVDDADAFVAGVSRVTTAREFTWPNGLLERNTSMLVSSDDVSDIQDMLTREGITSRIESVSMADAFRFAVGGGE